VEVNSISRTHVDWNCDGRIQPKPVATDVLGDSVWHANLLDLPGYNDWQKIIIKPVGTSAGAAPANAVGLGKMEGDITPKQADMIRLFPVTDINAATNGANVVVSWDKIPLDRVLAYRVYRSSGGGAPELIATIDDADHPSFTDLAPKGESLQYFVTAVFAPHSFAVAEGIEPMPVPVTNAEVVPRLTTIKSGWGISKLSTNTAIREFSNEARIAEIRAAAPAKFAALESFGAVTPQNQGRGGEIPKRLFETVFSAGAHVVVK
jgi:hypothetical protein